MPFDPTLWPRVIGQQRVKEALQIALRSARLPHAYLFYGPDGVGKDAMALELARVLHCERGEDEACGSCASCLRMASMQHPDVKLVVALPVGKNEGSDDLPLARLTEPEVREVQEQYRRKGENPYHAVSISRATIIKINSIREIRRESAMSTFGRARRVFIISRAEMMGEAAANTLLKTLEEPAGDTMLILTTAHREALLPTIVSRCQNVRFDRLTEHQIRTALVERDRIGSEQASLVARLADGSYARAQDLLLEDVLQWRRDVLSFVRHALAANAAGVLDDIETLTGSKDRDLVTRFLAFLLMWFRDALVLAQGGTIINLDQEPDLARFVARFPEADITRVMEDVERASQQVERNVTLKLVLTHLALRMKQTILGRRP